jgi:hypothetical protein
VKVFECAEFGAPSFLMRALLDVQLLPDVQLIAIAPTMNFFKR